MATRPTRPRLTRAHGTAALVSLVVSATAGTVWAQPSSANGGAHTSIVGVATAGLPLALASITVVDSTGQVRTATADSQGRYTVASDDLQAPLLLSAIEAGQNTNCRYPNRPLALCLAAYLPTLQVGTTNTANVNPLTDRVASDLAVGLQFTGPQQMVDSGKAPAVSAAALDTALGQMRAGFSTALKAVGVKDVEAFDPVRTPIEANGEGVHALLQVINHNRGYDNNSGETGHTVLTDIGFRPIAGLAGSGPYEPLDYPRAAKELAEIKAAPVRVLIVGDSTAATYELERLPRMGWGQVFQSKFRVDSGVKVLNGARAGRASRDFYNGRWYGQMARFLKPGDYVVINLGHNDQNCDSTKALRGAADVANLCSYPNTAQGTRQYPAGRPEMSFQAALENYIRLARATGATPLIMTPTTRYLNQDRKPAHWSGDTRPVVHSHFTTQNSKNGYAFVGDYSQTIKDTAVANGIPLIDLEAKSIAFANAHAADWTSYWLAVDPTDPRYPYYKTQTSGISTSPDTTHFQTAGAEAMADLVAGGIKETPALSSLAALLK